jgi:hypothetical protein
MILQDSPTGGIALLYGACHLGEFTIDTDKTSVRETVVWSDYQIESTLEDLNRNNLGKYFDSPARRDISSRVQQAREILFPDLNDRYYKYNPYTADYNNEQMESLVTLYTYSTEGREEMLLKLDIVFTRIAADLQEGHFSGDDTVFDYWPSEFGVAVAFAYDLDRLRGKGCTDHIEVMRRVWDTRAADYGNKLNYDGDDTRIEDFPMSQEVTPRP